MSDILVVDDEPGVVAAFHELLAGLGYHVHTSDSGEAALKLVRRSPPDVIVTDLSMPGMSGLDLFRAVRDKWPKLPVIIMTGRGTMETAIEATKLGAFDYQVKPFEPESMIAAIERALESVRLMKRSVELNPDSGASASSDAIVGECQVMQEVFKAVGRVAATDATVLIRGESGTGKELLARAIYQHSLRAEAPLLVVNCAAIPEALLESELFGHERGAFTGAHARRIGKFEQAHHGTVFLDEIGDLPTAVQAKVLRVLQQRTFERLGGTEAQLADVRILAATNRQLERGIAEGWFREDLYHRLNVVTIHIPPLRDRRSDIPKLANYFLDRYALELKVERPLITDEALELLCAKDWPGNVRELEHCLYRTVIFTHGYPIRAEDVSQAAEGQRSPTAPSPEGIQEEQLLELVQRYLTSRTGPGTCEWLLGQMERLLIAEALRRTNGNQTQAAQLLGLTRPTLHAKIQKHGLAPQRPESGG